ncbi:MAG: DUF455 family protein [Myxococcales bacterium]|nr:DUF455 family protein [Myxococcales bacterium]
MKQFIDHTELARDRRFVRNNATNQLFLNLPDDQELIIKLVEELAPVIQERVRGTPLEEVFDRLGPGFMLSVNFQPLVPGAPDLDLRLKLRLHGIFVGELQALEGAGRSLWDFPEAPWEFKLNMARQCWDEARHVQVYEKLLSEAGAGPGDYPESTFLFEACCAEDPALRVAGVNRGLEGLACDVFRDMIEFSKNADDPIMEQAIDFVLADELTHVRFGSEWVKEFTRQDPERARRAKEYQREVDRQFSFGGARSDREDAGIRIAWEDRKEAGFTEAELRELADLSAEGPKRETLMQAAEVLRQRHLEKRQSETVTGR